MAKAPAQPNMSAKKTPPTLDRPISLVEDAADSTGQPPPTRHQRRFNISRSPRSCSLMMAEDRTDRTGEPGGVAMP